MSEEKRVAGFIKISLASFNKNYKENFPHRQEYLIVNMEITAVYNSIKCRIEQSNILQLTTY